MLKRINCFYMSNVAQDVNCKCTRMLRTFLMSAVLILTMAWSVSCYSKNEPESTGEPGQSVQDSVSIISSASQDTISVIGVGDIMLGTNYPSSDGLPQNDGKDILAPVHSILQAADICFGNLEGTLLTGSGTPKQTANPSNCFVFKSPDHYVQNLSNAGFDVMSIANNHIGDFGVNGKKNTVRMLDSVDIKYAGLLEYPKVTFTKGNLRYGFCAFSPNNATVKLNDYETARRIIGELASECDIVIVSFHAGAEGSKHRNITRKREYYLGEDRGNPYEFARMAIDAGADILFGHGPHVTRAIDIYKNRFIAYSLGNFATYDKINIEGVKGLAPIIKVNVKPSGEFIDAQITSTRQVGKGGPILDPDNGVLKEIISLTQKDFPESPLHISDTGRVTLRNQ